MEGQNKMDDNVAGPAESLSISVPPEVASESEYATPFTPSTPFHEQPESEPPHSGKEVVHTAASNPAPSNKVRALRAQVHSSRGGRAVEPPPPLSRKPPVPKLSILSKSGPLPRRPSPNPVELREAEDVETLKQRRSQMSARPWRDQPLGGPVTKKDLLHRSKSAAGQVHLNEAGQLVQEDGIGQNELQMNISKFCCHRILLSKCHVSTVHVFVFFMQYFL